MRKLIKFSCLVISTATFLIAQGSDNLLSNGDFETSSLTGWGFTPYNENPETDTAAATREIDSTSGTAKEGKGFLRITVTKVTSENWHVQLLDPAWQAKTGYTYYYSAWVRADAPRQVQISVYGDAESQYTYRTSSSIFTVDTQWQELTMAFTADVDGRGKHNFALVLGFETGVYDIDNVVIKEEAPPEDGALYVNGDFEKGGLGWNLQVQGDAQATASYPEEGAKSGNKFCRIEVTALPEQPYELQLQDESWTCEMDREYVFEFYAKADNDTSMIQVLAQTGQTREWETLNSMDINLTTEWEKHTLTFSTGSIAGKDSVNVNITLGYNLGVYDFDSMSLIMVPVSVRPSRLASFNKPQPYVIRILPGQLQCVLADNRYVNKIDIHDLQGRLFYSAAFNGNKAGSYLLPRPSSGTWIIKLNSGKDSQQ
jgi:hypothetical protein